MKNRYFNNCLLILACFFSITATNIIAQNNFPYLGQTPPDGIALRFGDSNYQATNQWWWHSAPTFSPDSTEMYFTKYRVISETVHGTEIWFTKFENNQWTAPQTAAFSSYLYHDNNPCFKGNDTLYFHSQRSNYGFIFRMIRTQSGSWSTPVIVNLSIPSGVGVGLQFSVARNGNIYGELDNLQGTNSDIYLWKCLSNGQYAYPQLVAEICYNGPDGFPFVDPAERYIIFASNRPGGFCINDFGFELYISCKQTDNTWSTPQNLGEAINISGAAFPGVSSDGQYLFYNTIKTEDLSYNAYWINTSAIELFKPFLDIDKISFNKSTEIELYQNSPNPCNSQTTIAFELKRSMKISIEISDITGIKVMDLIKNKAYQKGKHEILLDLTKLEAGTYIYSLTSEKGEKLVKKMMVIK